MKQKRRIQTISNNKLPFHIDFDYAKCSSLESSIHYKKGRKKAVIEARINPKHTIRNGMKIVNKAIKELPKGYWTQYKILKDRRVKEYSLKTNF